MKKYGKYIASFASALLFFTVGAAWETASPSNLFFIIFGVCAVLPVLLTGANILLAKQYIGKINNTKVADMQGYMLRHRAEAEKTAAVFLRKLQAIRRATTAYAVFLWLLAVCAVPKQPPAAWHSLRCRADSKASVCPDCSSAARSWTLPSAAARWVLL